MKLNNKYILFWLGSSISQFGSSMTEFALIIWVYKQTGSAISVSLLTFFTYLPYILVSLFAGVFVDTHKKKSIILVCDFTAGIGSLIILILIHSGNLMILSIYIVNGIIGFMNAFQNPASMVAVGILISKEKYAKVSGLNALTNSLITTITPMSAAFLSSFWGISCVIYFDLITCLFHLFILFFLIPIQEKHLLNNKKIGKNVKEELFQGIHFLIQNQGILYIILSMALLNFLSRLTYENILTPMLLARSGGSDSVVGIVNGVLGIGGIAGGVLVSLNQSSTTHIRTIYVAAAFSFLAGDFTMGVGQTLPVWVFAALAASIPIPIITAGQNVLLYKFVPIHLQGRVFSVRNAFQFFTIPIGIILGGFMADWIFEPFMNKTSKAAAFLRLLVGSGKGSGMAVMFLGTGVIGFISCICFYRTKKIQNLK